MYYILYIVQCRMKIDHIQCKKSHKAIKDFYLYFNKPRIEITNES